MLTDPSIEKLKAKGASAYDVTVLVSKRARQLVDGAQPMVDDRDAANVVSLACREVAQDKVVAVEGAVEPVVPITREERIRRAEEEENRRKAREEEMAEREQYEQNKGKGLDDLLAQINDASVYEDEDVSSDGDLAEDEENLDSDEDIEPTEDDLAAVESKKEE